MKYISILILVMLFHFINLFSSSNIANNTINSSLLINSLIYSSYLMKSANSTTLSNRIKLDKLGNPVIMGRTNESGFPFSNNAFKNKLDSNNGQRAANGFLLKQNRNNFQIENATSIGIVDYIGYDGDLEIDDFGNCYIAVSFENNDNDIVANDNFNTHKTILLLKFNSDFSQLLASAYFGNELTGNKSIIYINDMEIDKKGNVVIVGYCDSNGVKTTTNSFQPLNPKVNQIGFIAKFTPDFQDLIFSSYCSGLNTDGLPKTEIFSNIAGIAIGLNNEIFVAGQTNFYDFPDYTISKSENPTEIQGLGDKKGFIAKISEDGSILLNSIINVQNKTDNYVGNYDILISKFGDIFVTGKTDNSLKVDISNGFQSKFQNGWITAGYIQCLDSSLNVTKYSTYFGNVKSEIFTRDLIQDKNSNVYMSGAFCRNNPKFGSEYLSTPITTKGAFPFDWLKVNSHMDGYGYEVTTSYIAIFDSTLSKLIYSTTFGNSDAVVFRDIQLDKDDNLYVTGYAAGAIYFPITENALWKTYYPYNPFLAKFSNLKDLASVDGFKIAPSNIFPNPATDYLNISFDSPKEGLGTIEIIDLLGIKVCSFDNYINEGNNSIKYSELDNLQTASYTVKVTINNEIVSIGKFIKR